MWRNAPDKVQGTYHEPFLGSGAAFFGFGSEIASAWCLSDTNTRLIQTHTMVRDRLPELLDGLTLIDDNPTREQFIEVRTSMNQTKDPLETAIAFLYINSRGFNGLYRENSSGDCNTPYGCFEGSTVNNPLAKKDTLKTCSKLLQGATITRQDFRQSLAICAPGDFVYLDPPYVPLSTTSNFTSYSAGGFSPKDQADLVAELHRLNSMGVQFLLSNSNTPETRTLYAGFEMEEVRVNRYLAGKAEARGEVSELLVRNYTPKPSPESYSLDDFF